VICQLLTTVCAKMLEHFKINRTKPINQSYIIILYDLVQLSIVTLSIERNIISTCMIHICNCIGWKNFCQELDSISVLCLSVWAFVDTYAFVLWKLLWAIQWNSAVHMWCTANISCHTGSPRYCMSQPFML